MPSDPRVAQALELLAGPVAEYRAAVAATIEELRALLATAHADLGTRARQMKERLGSFADGRIDTERLAWLLGDRGTLDPHVVARLGIAAQALGDAMEEQPHVTIAAGEDLAHGVDRKLAFIGRVFAAARVASAARSGVAASVPDAALHAFPYREWTGAERRLAPPLVISVRGSDLHAGALAPFLDGMQKLLVVVEGECTPAPLVRLITPGVLVIQAHEASDLKGIASWPGPAVGAWVPAAAARFTHDPARGPHLWERMTVQAPEEVKLSRINGISVQQQREELQQLEAMASRSGPAAVHDMDAVTRLAAWLIENAADERGE